MHKLSDKGHLMLSLPIGRKVKIKFLITQIIINSNKISLPLPEKMESTLDASYVKK